MKKNLVMAFIGLGLLLASCSSDISGDPIATAEGCATDVQWLQPGKYVKYNLTQFGFTAGQMQMTFGECNGTGFVTERKMTDMSGNVISTTQDLVYREGNYVYNDVGMDGGYASILYKKGAQLGDTWSVTDDSGRVVTHEVVDIDSLVTVPAGTYHCKVYKYTTSTSATESFVFWNDEVGNVKESGSWIGMELQSHNY